MTTLEKIRAEIDIARFIDKDTKLCKNANASGLEVALQIIDKYAEQEPCDDAVSREAVILLASIATMSIDETVKAIKRLPSVRPQEQTGHWIRQDNTKEPLYGWYFCSECNSVIGEKTKFCSNCGAKM